MPTSTLDRKLLHQRLGRELSPEELEREVFRTKGEVSGITAESFDLEVTSDRLDLLSESGFALALAGLLGTAEGLAYRPDPPAGPSSGTGVPDLHVAVDPSVSPLRREITMAVARAPPGDSLDADLLHELVRFQEALHATLGADRKRGSIGLYPLAKLTPPFQYAMEGLDGIRFTPLPEEGASSVEVSGIEFFDRHPMATQYGTLGRKRGMTLTLRDAKGRILSLPPILNSAVHGQLVGGETTVLLESTGTLEVTVHQLAGYMILPFVARGWHIAPVPVRRRSKVDGGEVAVANRALTLPSKQVGQVLGMDLPALEVGSALRAARLGVRDGKGGWEVEVPPWRPDILGPVDLAEEVMIVRGLSSFPPVTEAPVTEGHRLPLKRYALRFLEVLVGLGYQEGHTPAMLPRALVEQVGPAHAPITLANPASLDFEVLRSSLLPGLLQALSRNTHGAYPQRIFEISEVVVPDGEAITGSRTELHLAYIDAGEGAGFARSAAIGEHLAKVIGILPTREAGEAKGSIPGRVAQLRFAGDAVATLGELHPEVLSDWRIAEPVSWGEWNLSLLWRLKGH